MSERLHMPVWQKFAPLAVGVGHAVYTTLPVRNLESRFWSNDESRFLEAGQSPLHLDIRYGLFGILTKFYHLVADDPFLIVMLHKVVVLIVFLAIFQRRVWADRGGIIFFFVFSTFLYLNSYFLRESLIFTFMLLAVLLASAIPSMSFSFDGQAAKRVAGLFPLVLLRPQNVLFFVRPWMSVLATIGFLALLRGQYAQLKLNGPSYFAVIDKAEWSKIIGTVMTTLSNLNPLIKFPFFFEQGLYLDYVLLLLGSVALFAVFVQLALSLCFEEFRFSGADNVCTGIGCLLVMYGALVIAADVRIFFAAVCPFVFRVRKDLFGWWSLAGIILIWLTMTLIRYFLDS